MHLECIAYRANKRTDFMAIKVGGLEHFCIYRKKVVVCFKLPFSRQLQKRYPFFEGCELRMWADCAACRFQKRLQAHAIQIQCTNSAFALLK